MSDGRDEKDSARSPEPLLARWSRRKAEAREAAADRDAAVPKKQDDAPAPRLPSLEELTPESDFAAFFHPKVGDDVRRAALKKLFFGDPRFNVMDGLDVYIDDYSRSEPIPPQMMATLRQAQGIFESARRDADERERKRLAQERTERLEAPSVRTEARGEVAPGAAVESNLPKDPPGSAQS